MVLESCSRDSRVCGVNLSGLYETKTFTFRLCYIGAILISSTNMSKIPSISWKRLVDIRGFKDSRYSVLAIGAFIAMLGQFIPYYYISTLRSNPHQPA